MHADTVTTQPGKEWVPVWNIDHSTFSLLFPEPLTLLENPSTLGPSKYFMSSTKWVPLSTIQPEQAAVIRVGLTYRKMTESTLRALTQVNVQNTIKSA